MYGLRDLPLNFNSQEDYIVFLLASLGLPIDPTTPDIVERVIGYLTSPTTAQKLLDNMREFYLCLTPEYLALIYSEAMGHSGLDPVEFKMQIIQELNQMTLDYWLDIQLFRLAILKSWPSI